MRDDRFCASRGKKLSMRTVPGDRNLTLVLLRGRRGRRPLQWNAADWPEVTARLWCCCAARRGRRALHGTAADSPDVAFFSSVLLGNVVLDVPQSHFFERKNRRRFASCFCKTGLSSSVMKGNTKALWRASPSPASLGFPLSIPSACSRDELYYLKEPPYLSMHMIPPLFAFVKDFFVAEQSVPFFLSDA